MSLNKQYERIRNMYPQLRDAVVRELEARLTDMYVNDARHKAEEAAAAGPDTILWALWKDGGIDPANAVQLAVYRYYDRRMDGI